MGFKSGHRIGFASGGQCWSSQSVEFRVSRVGPGQGAAQVRHGPGEPRCREGQAQQGRVGHHCIRRRAPGLYVHTRPGKGKERKGHQGDLVGLLACGTCIQGMTPFLGPVPSSCCHFYNFDQKRPYIFE